MFYQTRPNILNIPFVLLSTVVPKYLSGGETFSFPKTNYNFRLLMFKKWRRTWKFYSSKHENALALNATKLKLVFGRGSDNTLTYATSKGQIRP